MLWSSGFLPAIYQGVEFNSAGASVHHLNPDRPLPPGAQRRNLELLAKMNAVHRDLYPQESELEGRIQNYELAARMQLETASVMDLSKESEDRRRRERSCGCPWA